MADKQDNGQPRFNFPKQSVRQQKEVAKHFARINALSQLATRAKKLHGKAEKMAEESGVDVKTINLEDIEGFQPSDLDMPGPEELEQVYDDWVKILVRCVTYVPRSWLLDHAPDEIDWTDTDAYYDYLDDDYWGDLQAAFAEARNPENEALAGNSKRRSGSKNSTPKT